MEGLPRSCTLKNRELLILSTNMRVGDEIRQLCQSPEEDPVMTLELVATLTLEPVQRYRRQILTLGLSLFVL
jgi:hypothetical protein